MISRLFCWAIAWALAAFPAAAGAEIDIRNPPAGTISEGWYAVLLSGKKSGHMHSLLERQGDSILSTTEIVLALRRGSAVVSIGIDSRTEEAIDGAPKKMASVMNLGTQTATTTTVVFDGPRATVTTEQFGQQTTATHTLSRTPMLAWAGYVEQTRRGFEPETAYTVPTYEPSLKPNDVILSEIYVVGPEEIDLLGRTTRGTKVKTRVGTLEQVAWVDADGEILKTGMPIMGLSFEMVRCDKTFALQEKDPPEMFIQSMVAVDKSLDTDTLKRLRLRLSVPEGEFPDLPETQMQKVRRIDARTVELTITRIDHATLRNARPGQAAGEAADCLRPNVYMDFHDAVVSQMAADAVNGASNLYEKVDRLRRYVSTEITDKSLDVGLATAGEVARCRQGDCTEHAVLLAALGRGNGIPARVVSGLAYVRSFLGHSDAFGYHMWTQYYLDGKWVDVDAAFRQTQVDPTHVALSVMPLNDEGFFDSAFTFIPLMGRLKIEVLDAEQ